MTEHRMVNVREQHPVGHGFFHSGVLDSAHPDDRRRLLYVYDCGALSSFNRRLHEEVDEFRAAGAARIDLLFLSHMHADHVDGVPRLLDGVQVQTVVLPFIDDVERLIVFAQSLVEGADPAGFHADLVADPTGALVALGARQIIYVRRSSDEDGRAEDGAGDVPPLRDGPAGDGELSWKMFGRGDIQRGDPSGRAPSSPADVWVADDVNSLGVRTQHGLQWIFAPYVEQGSTDKDKFLKALARERKITGDELRAALGDPAFRRNLITRGKSQLKKAYSKVRKDLNVGSLCLYSGPPRRHVPGSERLVGEYVTNVFGRQWHGWCERFGWLGTGDAKLDAARFPRFQKHYATLLSQVQTLAVPHHGSEPSSCEELYRDVGAQFFVTSSGSTPKKWRLPASSVVRAIGSQGAACVTVTDAPASRFLEHVFL